MPKKKPVAKKSARLLNRKNVPFATPMLVLMVLMFLSMGVLFVVSSFAATVG